MDGCKYKVSHLKTTKILSQEEDGEGKKIYLWDEVEGLGAIKTFHEVRVSEKEEGHSLLITSSIPSAEVREELRKKYNLNHKTPFSEMDVSWEIKEAAESSEVTYTIHAESSDPTLSMFHKKVMEGMKETANQLFGHLRR